MKKLSIKIAMFGLLLLTVFVNGCASTTIIDPGKLADFAMPSPGKSKVVFIRPGSFAKDVHFAVHDGEQMIGRSSVSTYFAYECDPGHHLFSTSMDNVDILNADLLPDRIYYVKVTALIKGWGGGWVKMSPLYSGCAEINWEQMPTILAKLRKSTITSKQVEHDTTGIEGYMKRLDKHQSNPQADTDAETVLPEYGQTSPLFSQ